MYSIYQVFLKNSLAVVELLPRLQKGSLNRRLVLGTSPVAALLAGIPVWGGSSGPRLLSIVLHMSLEPLCPGHVPTAIDTSMWSLLHSSHRAKRGAASAQSIANLCGANQQRERRKEGEYRGNGMNQLRIDPNTNSKILYFI